MRKKLYKDLPTTLKDGSKPITSESKGFVFIKKTYEGEYLYNFKDYDALFRGSTASKTCHFCINSLACKILKSEFCSGKNFLPAGEYLPTFKKLENSSQLASAMGYFYTHISGWFRNLSKDENKYYNNIEIPKSDGTMRQIYEPTKKLKIIQARMLETVLYKYIKLPNYVTGCVPGKCTYDNAEPHVNKSVVIKMDLKDFFPSVYAGRVYKCLLNYFPDHVSKMITRLCCYKGHVAQGIPTSGFLADIAALDMDKELVKLCRSRKWDYTRYVDDMTFSVKAGRENVSRTVVDNFIKAVYPIVGRNCFTINSKKTKIMRRGRRQKVTGIIVNEKPNIPKHNRNIMRAIIHNCSQRGVDSQKRDLSKKAFIQKVEGYLSYMKRINEPLWEKMSGDWKKAKSWRPSKTAKKDKQKAEQ